MTAAIIVLSVAVTVLAVAMWAVIVAQHKAQKLWQAERRELVNRVVARHAGEAIALDHSAAPKQAREPREQILVEGLS